MQKYELNAVTFRFVWVMAKIGLLLPYALIATLAVAITFMVFWALPLVFLGLGDNDPDEYRSLGASLFDPPKHRFIITLTVDVVGILVASLLIWFVPKYNRDKKKGR